MVPPPDLHSVAQNAMELRMFRIGTLRLRRYPLALNLQTWKPIVI